jgi:hypothetical protein
MNHSPQVCHQSRMRLFVHYLLRFLW